MAVKNQNLLELVVNSNPQLPIADKMLLTLNIMNFVPPRQLNVPYTNFYKPGTPEWKSKFNSDLNKVTSDWDLYKKRFFNGKSQSPSVGNQLASSGVNAVTNYLSETASNELFGSDTDLGRTMGTLFSSGISSAGNTIADNLLKGNALTQGLAKNVGTSLAGAGVGLLSQGIGKGINSIGGDSMLSRGIGLGVATGLGTIGGRLLTNGTSNLFGSANSIFSAVDKMKKAKDATEAANLASKASAINPYALGAQVVGSALGAALGPSKEYGGRYGNVTRTLDTIYDTASAAVNFIPGAGQFISAGMALNKGLSNLFGSTDGMTVLDAVLGSAFMLAPVKWLNMAGSSKTGTFNNLSWLNTEKADSFMQDAFGNLSDKFDKARVEAGKTYGTFSQGARRRALSNINFANYAWGEILDMANLNNYQNIRSLDMASINNLRYAQNIQGGWSPLAIGKQGMKILNNATNHNIGMRLLSGAALIDNKQMILSAQGGTKVRRPARPLPRKPATREENPELWDEWERRDAERNASKQRVYLLEREAAIRRAETNARHALHYSNLATGVAETVLQNALFEPVTQESLQNSNTEQVRQELLADKNEYFDRGMDFINAAGFADLGVNVAGPLLLRGFRWAFNKAGLLVKVPLEKTNLFLTSPYTGKWTQFGNREYRFKPGYVGMNGVPVESRILKITEANAASITPEQWTAAQDAAIARGDMAEAQRLRDLHFKVSAPNTKVKEAVFNGSLSDKPFYEFNTNFRDAYWGGRDDYTTGAWFGTGDKNTLLSFAGDNPNRLKKFYLNFSNPFIKDAGYRRWDKLLPFNMTEEDIAIEAAKLKEKGFPEYVIEDWKRGLETTTDNYALKLETTNYDSGIIKNVYENKAYPDSKYGVITDYIAAKPNQIKSADAVTYDDKGIRIPLGERDSKLNDIRYSWLPWFLGGSTATTLYNKSK